MQEQDPLYEYIKTTMLEVMAVLYSNGQHELHVGAMMRLVGVEESVAALHDNERINIDESLADMAEELDIQHILRPRVPAGATIH